jgi:hypothetical protein
MSVSAVGKKKFAAFGGIIVLNIAVLALSIGVNIFQGFFFVADLFPLVLSITTLTIFLLLIFLELTASNAFTARPVFEIPLLVILTLTWLGFDAFSTSRWSGIPTSCSVISDEYSEVRSWCQHLQALKAVIWLVWVTLLILTSSLLCFVVTHAHHGKGQVWRTPLSRYDPSNRHASSVNFITEVSSYYRGSSIFNFRIRTSAGANELGNVTPSSHDFFAPPSPVFRDSSGSSAFGGVKAGVGTYQHRIEKDEFKAFETGAGGTVEDGVSNAWHMRNRDSRTSP